MSANNLATKAFLGIDVGGTNLRVGLVSEQGKVLETFKESTTLESPKLLLHQIKNLVDQINAIKIHSISSIGIGWPGPVDIQNGTVFESPNISGFKNFPLKNELEKILKIPVQIDNDAKCAGFAEKKFGAAKNFSDFILLTFGTGIGGVIFINNQLVRGKSGFAGEIGHMTLHPKGEACSCGGFGCFERYCSAKALERRSNFEFTAREILEKSISESRPQQLIQEYVTDLAIGIGSLASVLEPQAIVFSGGLFTTGGEIILKTLREKIDHQGFSAIKKNIQLVPSSLHGQAGFIGAASLVMG